MPKQPTPPSQAVIVFQLLGLIAVTIFTFLGLIYVFNGDPLLTGFLSILALVLLKLIVNFMVKMKQRTELNQTRTPEYVLGGGYLILFIILFPVCFHMLNIEIFHKNDIKNAALNKLGMLDTVRDEYRDAVKSKKSSLEVNATKLFNNYQIQHSQLVLGQLATSLGTTATNINTRAGFDQFLRVAKAAIDQKYDITANETELLNFKRNAEPVFTNWQMLDVSFNYQKIDNVYNKYYAAAISKMPGFVSTAQLTDAFNLRDPFSSFKGNQTGNIIISLIGLLLIHFCILVPFFTAKRHDILRPTQSKSTINTEPRIL